MKTSRWALVLLLVTGACTLGQGAIESFANDDDERAVEEFLRLVRSGEFEEANRRLALSVHDSVSDERWDSLRAVLVEADLDSLYLIGASTNLSSGVRTGRFTYEGPAGDGWIQGVVTFHHLDITGANFGRAAESLGATNAFRLRGRGFGQYVFALLALGVGAFSLGTAVRVFRSRMPKRKRWVLASLVGVSGTTMNWTTGATATKLVHVGLPVVAGMKAGPWAPWLFTVSFPVGAIMAMRAARVARARIAPEPTGPDQPPEVA